MESRGKVPHFTLRPHPLVSMALFLVVVVGLLVAMSFFSKEEGAGEYRQRGISTLIITGILTIFMTILATSKLWFSHLWKKNSTHARLKNHTRFHPTVKDREFRERQH